MRFEIDINDEVLETLVTNEVNNIDKQIISDIAMSAIKEYLSRDSTLSEIIFKDSVYAYSKNRELRPEIWRLIEKTFNPADISDIQDRIASYMIEHRKDLLIEVMAQTFSKQLFTDEFRQEMAMIMAGKNI